MQYHFVILLALIFIIPEVINYKVMRLDRFEVCGQPDNSTFSVKYLEIHHVQHGSIVSCKFQLRRDYKKIKFEFDVARCANKEHLDSCEKYPKLKMPNACPLINDKNTILSSLFYAFDPPLLCPLKKGEYTAKNASFDPNKMQIVPLENNYWKFRTKFIDGETNKMIFELCCDGQIVKN